MTVPPTLNSSNLPDRPVSKSDTTFYGLLIRLISYMAPFALVFVPLVTVIKGAHNIPFRIGMCLLIGILTVISRFIEMRYLGGTDSNGRPLTVKSLMLYARNILVLTVLAVLVMIIFH